MKRDPKIHFTLNSNAEKAIAAASISAAAAILFGGKKKNTRGGRGRKKQLNFVQRVKKNYSIADRLLIMTVAKGVADEERKKAMAKEFKTKLRDLEIEGSVPFDPGEKA
ncbi:MAG: hypothetical protein IJ737_01905 [Ruminococcus sp.]|nr:hypothetical protein [Ruminococcus sp.]